MGELVDELEGLGYVVRGADPTDRRAKLITLTEAGRRCVSAGINTIGDIERRIDDALGVRRHRDLRRMLLGAAGAELNQAPTTTGRCAAHEPDPVEPVDANRLLTVLLRPLRSR